MSGGRHVSWMPDVLVGAALLALLAANLGLAYVPLDWGNAAVSLAIAAVQASLVAAVFMGLRQRKTLMRLSAAAALAFLAVMFTLSFADYLNRPLQHDGAGAPAEMAPGPSHRTD